MEETGVLTNDNAKPHHQHTLTGTPSWASLANGTPYLSFNPAHPDYLQCPAAATADLNFTAGDFSLMVWMNTVALLGYPLMNRGATITDGWSMNVSAEGKVSLLTRQGGTGQSTFTVNVILINQWYLIMATRSGASCHIYINGAEPAYSSVGVHVNPAAAVRNMYFGCFDAGGAPQYSGYMYRPRIWGRQLSAAEAYQLFQLERDLFGV